MTAETKVVESCDPRPLPDGNPNIKWTAEEVATYAHEKHNEIVASEKPLAVLYWRLGLALHIARSKHKYGKWGQYLESLGIDKTRASKAQAIYKTNRAEERVSELSVAEAYARRKRKKKQSPKTGPAIMSDTAESRGFLKGICMDGERYYDVAAFLKPPEASEFLMDVEKTIQKLEKIRDCLRQRVQQ
jgi:hypothetical protein